MDDTPPGKRSYGKNMLTNFLLWLHFIGIGMAMGGGIALSQVGPRLIAAPANERELLWFLEVFFSRIGAGGLAILLLTGPLMLWLKFGGPSGLSWWFSAKMILVLVALTGVCVHEWAGRRFRKGDLGAVPAMFIGGRVAGIGIVSAMLCAVFTFNLRPLEIYSHGRVAQRESLLTGFSIRRASPGASKKQCPQQNNACQPRNECDSDGKQLGF